MPRLELDGAAVAVEEAPEPLPHQRLVVDQGDADHAGTSPAGTGTTSKPCAANTAMNVAAEIALIGGKAPSMAALAAGSDGGLAVTVNLLRTLCGSDWNPMEVLVAMTLVVCLLKAREGGQRRRHSKGKDGRS